MQRTLLRALVNDPVPAQSADTRKRTTVRPRRANLARHVARAVPAAPQTRRPSVVALRDPQLVRCPAGVEKLATSDDTPVRSNEVVEAVKSAHRPRFSAPEPSVDTCSRPCAGCDDLGAGEEARRTGTALPPSPSAAASPVRRRLVDCVPTSPTPALSRWLRPGTESCRPDIPPQCLPQRRNARVAFTLSVVVEGTGNANCRPVRLSASPRQAAVSAVVAQPRAMSSRNTPSSRASSRVA